MFLYVCCHTRSSNPFIDTNSCLMFITGIGAYFGAQCEKHGMLVRVSGDNIMMSPPFIISPEEVDEVG